MANRIPILDSHIHLYPASELDTLSWCSPDNPLTGQHSLDEYAAATSLPPNLEGFIFLETDRIHDLATGLTDGSGYKYPLQEIEWLQRIALGTPRPGEGHDASQAHLCRAIIPWAPLPSGAVAMEKYVEMVKEVAEEEVFEMIRGFRYLVQGKGKGVMTAEGFIEGLKWMGRHGFVFDLGMDCHRDGVEGLMEAMEMIGKAHDGVEKKDKVVFILNHLLKPNMTITGDVEAHPDFTAWREGIYQLSRCDKTYIKLSGCFSEIDPNFEHDLPKSDSSSDPPPGQFSEQEEEHLQKLLAHLLPYLAVILTAFKPYRILFGSDWPVCTVGGVKRNAWKKWVWIVERMCELAGLSVEDQVMIWSGTAVGAYGIQDMM